MTIASWYLNTRQKGAYMKKWQKIILGLVGDTIRQVAKGAKDDEVTSPAQLSSRSWQDALKEVKNALKNKNLPILAAGVAYFSTLAFFPLMAAVVAIAGLVLDSHQLKEVISAIEAYLPGDMASLVSTQLKNAIGHHSGNVIVAIIAILISLFGVSSATQNLITATNISYNRQESRGFIKLRLISLLITVSTIVGSSVVVALLLVNQKLLEGLGWPGFLTVSLPYLRWIILAVLVTIGLAAFYRYGPDRENAKWQWVSWGAAIATVAWLIGTALFFLYAQYFANFSNTYSLFAGIIVLMTWLNLTAFIMLLGAEINHRLENKASEENT
jgi:membrane protein